MAKHKYIETPEKMWELFLAYASDVKTNPRHIIEYHGKDGDEKRKPLERPLTLEGFKEYGHQNGVTIQNYFDNPGNRYDEYNVICIRVREAIRRDQIEGGMVGQYNASITQRLNGLTDKQQVDLKTDKSPFNSFDVDVPGDNSTG